MYKFLVLLSIPLLLIACKPSETPEEEGPLTAVATTGMVADIVKNVAGDHVKVTALMGPGVDPHLYKASPGDVQALQKADVIFYNGLFLEGKMAEIFEQLAERKVVMPVAEEISESSLIETTAFQGHPDPHVWFDVALWEQLVEPVAEKLAELDPVNAGDYRANAKSYRAQLTELNKWVVDEVSQIPEDQRVMITAHDAFGYFGRAYGIEVLGIQGISTESEPGLKEINELVDTIVNRRVKAVFVETSVSDRNVKSIIEGAQSRGADVKLGGQLFSDAMGDPNTDEGTYLGMVRHNVRTIVEALK